MRYFVVFVLFILLSCSPYMYQPEKEYPENNEISKIPQPKTDCPIIKDSEFENSIYLFWMQYDPGSQFMGIRTNRGMKVRHADAVQNGCIIKLFLTVDYAVSDGEAKTLGEELVIQINKSSHGRKFSFKRIAGVTSGFEIEKGPFTYFVQVYYPDNKLVVTGVKKYDSTYMEWEE